MLSFIINAWRGLDVDGVPIKFSRREGLRVYYEPRKSHNTGSMRDRFLTWVRGELPYWYDIKTSNAYEDAVEWLENNATDLWNYERLKAYGFWYGCFRMRSERDAALFKLFFSDRIELDCTE